MTSVLDPKEQAAQWWATDIIKMSPGVIQFHGYPIQELIGQLSFTAMIWLMLKGDVPNPEQETLFNAALMAGVDHGPQAPSIAIARMAMSCGVGINNAMASAANVLGDVHGGAGEQCLEFFQRIQQGIEKGLDLDSAIQNELHAFFASGKKYVPGFGHRFHPIDPRSRPLMQLLETAEHAHATTGNYREIALGVEHHIASLKSRPVPMNIDGATAAIYGALGFPAALCRGLFVLSRSVGILTHAWEQNQASTRNKGPMPKGWLWSYTGTPERNLNTPEA
ncbi:citryl-CoA lyase [Alcaligenaceae bacterium 429]|nr:citryl-CoA lyase [Alcaligenaceae bacterium 429]